MFFRRRLRNRSAVLTNKRLYCNHKTGIVNIRTQEENVNAKDITDSKIANFNPLGILIMAFPVLIIGIVTAVGGRVEEMIIPVILAFLGLVI